jgi:hypothetical protein
MDNLYAQQKFPSPVDKEVVARDWSRQGYSCDWFVDPPGREWNDFVHRCNELVTVAEGRLEMTIGDKNFPGRARGRGFHPQGGRALGQECPRGYDALALWL